MARSLQFWVGAMSQCGNRPDRNSEALGNQGRDGGRQARLLDFADRKQRTVTGQGGAYAGQLEARTLKRTPRERFLRAIEMERRGFSEGAVANLHHLCREVDVESDPSLAICICYFLASFLMLRGEIKEARALTEDGILLAWEYGAEEEMELLEHLSEQLEE